jgi:beta-mannosidase
MGETSMTTFSLNGIWKMRRTDWREWIEGSVPGSVYNDLLNIGLMEDPFYRENDKKAAKLSEYDYEYQRSFEVESAMLEHDRVLLCCEGLDTLAEIHLNGSLLAKTCNMHRIYEFDVKGLLNIGENSIHIIFRNPVEYVTKRYEENPLFSVNGIPGFQFLRKAHYMFGWDWGPTLPDLGIWRNISLVALSFGRIDEVYVTQQHEAGRVSLDIRVGLEKLAEGPVEVISSIYAPDGKVHTKRVVTSKDMEHVFMEICDPELWWPNGFGKQPLYRVEVCFAKEGFVMDTRTFKIGLRTIRVNQRDDQWGRSFAFEVNGIEIFAMGADYIPEDNIIARVDREKTERLIQDCVAANFNCLRMWGGGYYYDDCLYDLCDEYGLIVWQDMLYACALYDFSDDFRSNIIPETVQNMKRIRHHACLGLWCGNNEMEWAVVDWNTNASLKAKADYIKQFECVLPEIAKEVDPNTFYWLASPSSFGGFDRPNDQNFGDMHDWSVWHGRMPFTDFRSRYPRFMSEFGLQSFPGMKTIEAFALPEDYNIFSAVIEDHQKHPAGIDPTVYYLSQYFKFPGSFESFPYVSQLIQAEGVRYGVEHWRRNRGRCMGAVYWQLNDCWPVVSWASIDYYGRWKALHYAAKRFFAPVLASACEEGTCVSLHISNETMEAFSGKLVWSLRDACSNVVRQAEKRVDVAALSSLECERLDFADILDSEEKLRSHYLHFELLVGQNAVSGGTTLFVPAKYFKFLPTKLQVIVEETADRFILTVTSGTALAKFVELDLKKADVVFSDNYFDLSAGERKMVTVDRSRISARITLEEFKNQLTVRSLIDTY